MTNPFSRPTLAIVIGVAVASLVVAAVLTLFGDELGERRSAGVDGYSRSAIGHRALVKLLEKLDIPVVVSRSDSVARARRGLLVIAEPTVTDDAARSQLTHMIEQAPNVLVVMPKWFGSVELGQPWIDDVHPVPVEEVQHTADALGLEHTMVIARDPGMLAVTKLDGPVAPVIRQPQLLVSEDLEPAVAAGDRVVVGISHGDKKLAVLSDPDVLSNFGLRSPANARFAVALIDRLRGDGPVVIDETLHGFAQTPSLSRTLLRFPLVIATAQVLICALLVVWAAMVRFGPRRVAPPPLAPGKDFLIRNTAALLHYGGHHAHALKRYLQLSVTAVRHALHAPALPQSQMTAWLERVRLARRGTISLATLEQEVEAARDPARVVELADQVFRWRMEMTDGSDART